MKFVKAEWSSEWRGFWTDGRDYLAELQKFADKLPKGAREFASQPGHYDFGSAQCVKDLKLQRAEFLNPPGAGFEIVFGPNEWKHEAGLVIRYAGVSQVDISLAGDGASLSEMTAVLLDEILPAESGCSHEIVHTGGTVMIYSQDLVARWQ